MLEWNFAPPLTDISTSSGFQLGRNNFTKLSTPGLGESRSISTSVTRKSMPDAMILMHTPQSCSPLYPNGPEAGREAGWGSEFVPLKKREVGSFILLHKISRTACCFGIRTFLKQYNCYESATNWYTDHQYLAQYSEIINNLQEIPLIFCN